MRNKRQHTLPVIRWTETKPEKILILRLHHLLPGQTPNLSRSSMVDLADSGVESSNAAKTGSEGNLTHGQIRLVEKLLCEVHLARPCHRTRRSSQVLEKQAAKMTRANSKAFRERFYSAIVQATLTNQPQRPRNGIWSPHPSRSPGRTFRPATQTGPEARRGRGGRGWKITNIFFFRRRCGTNGAAINSAGEDTNKEFAVEARIARQPGSRTNLPIQFHFLSSDDSPEPGEDMDVFGLRSQ